MSVYKGKAKHRKIDLAGLSVLVTRPAEQAAALSESIQTARGRPVSFPAMEILGPKDKKAAKAQLADLHKVDLLVFISTNAVNYAFPLMPDDIPLDLQIAAVGRATASALDETGLEPTLVPNTSMDSEGLLALPELQDMQGKKVLIVRGNSGRETLRDVLIERGAQIEYVEVYRRQLPERNPANLIANWEGLVDVVTITSGQILNNLFSLLGESGADLLRTTPLVVVSERVAEQAAELGCEFIYIADSAMDAAIIKSLDEINRELF